MKPFGVGTFDVCKDYRGEKIIACIGISHDLRMHVQQAQFYCP